MSEGAHPTRSRVCTMLAYRPNDIPTALPAIRIATHIEHCNQLVIMEKDSNVIAGRKRCHARITHDIDLVHQRHLHA
jgi:hypothetical protein